MNTNRYCPADKRTTQQDKLTTNNASQTHKLTNRKILAKRYLVRNTDEQMLNIMARYNPSFLKCIIFQTIFMHFHVGYITDIFLS